ncbi:MAG: hypothetical protein K6D94_11615, partial [Clostridiales bacterium]|nr:hypothetical protein [Clostridiales bacterium]
IEWSDAEGWLAINENGGLDWNDSREERCSEMIFERYEYYPIEQSEIIDSYFRLIGGFAPDESGSSLKRARAARDAVKFASENNIWTRDVGQLRDSLLEAWESLDEADQLAFDANFIDICRLIDDCREDWKESSGLFADAGISDMEKLLLDEKAMLSWSVLASNTLTLGNSDGV